MGSAATNPLIVQFVTSGQAHSSTDPIVSYTLNFGDGDVISMPIPSGGGTGTLSLDLAHDYTSQGTFYPTLTLVGNDGAATVKDAPSIVITGNNTVPTVALSYSTSTSKLTAVFSEDVGAALVGQYNTSYTALGEHSLDR